MKIAATLRWLLMISVAVYCMVAGPDGSYASAPMREQTPLPANFERLSGPQAVNTMPTELLDGAPDAVRLRFSDPPLELGSVSLEGADFSTIRLSGEASTLETGLPELPRLSRLVMVGNTGQIAASVIAQSYHVEYLDAPPAPVQPDEGEAQMFAAPDPGTYGEDAWYPPVVVEVTEPAALRDVRFVVLTVYPVQVNPVTRELRVYDQLDVAVDNIGGVGANEIAVVPTSLTPGFRSLYSAFENFRGSALDELPVVPGKQLIICDNNASVITEVQKLVNWRRRKGLDAFYATLTQIGGTDAATIRTYIQNQYNASGGTLEFVTLIGDPDAAAPYNIATHGSQLDNYYGALTGGPNADPVPDVAVGRISVSDGAQLAAIITKTINYESDPLVTDTTWFNRAWCAAHTNMVHSNPSTKEYTRQIMLQHGLNPVTFDVFSGGMVQTTLENRINQGVSVFNDRMSWVGEFGTNQVDALANGRKLPFVMVITCGTGSFSGGTTLSEAWLRPDGQTTTNPKGAIGAVGLSGLGTHVPYNNIVDAGTMWGYFVQGIREQGIAVIAGKLQLYRNYQSFRPGSVQDFCDWMNLMGDPGVPIWTETPRSPAVARPATIHRNANNVAVTVTRGGLPVEDALVGLVKGTETFARGYTNPSGYINLPVDLPTTGYLHITVTGRGIDSYLDSIQVVTPTQSLSFFSVAVDDDNVGGTVGDGNGVLNPGETVDLTIRLRNSGSSQAVTNITGTLTASLPGIQMLNGTQNYPDLAVGADAAPDAPFRIQVGQVFNGEPIAFFVNTNSSAGNQTIRTDLTPVAGDVTFVSSAFLDANSRLDPGEAGGLTVTFRNSGGRTLSSASGILRSLDGHVTITDSVGTYGNVAPATQGTNSGNAFGVSASVQTVGGYQAALRLVVTDVNGFRDSTDFYQTVGVAAATTPTGPDAYGYYACDNTETQPAGSASNYLWASIVPPSGPGQSLGFTDGGEDQDNIAVRTLPFDFTFYGESFNQVTICSNGWLAFGSQSIDDFRNYRIGSPIGPGNMVAAYWDDLIVTGVENGGVYVWSDVSTNRYIVEWRTRGLWSSQTEIFQVILHDPDVYSSPTGDGKILVLYNTVNPAANSGSNDNDYFTVGIQNRDHSIGLEYSYWNTYPITAAPLANGRAIMYTTDWTGTVPTALSLVSPNGGETWYQHRQASVTWFGGEAGHQIRIELSRNGAAGPWETVTASTPNDGEYSFTVGGPPAADCRIRISSVQDPTETDASAAGFAIAPLLLLTPNGGESWIRDSLVTVTWIGGDLAADVRVELSRAGLAGPWELITAATSNDGVHSFAVGGATSDACRVRVTSLADPVDTDVSDANFSVIAIQSVLTESFEAGAPGWTHSSPTDWLDQWHISTERALSGTHSYKCGDTGAGTHANLCDSRLESPVMPNLPAGATLHFHQQYGAELSGSFQDSAYDGCVVEIAANGGAWVVLHPVGAYPKTFRHWRNQQGAPATGPMLGYPCYSGSAESAWTEPEFDLSAFARQDIQLRFRFGSDAATAQEGWYIDDVAVFAPLEVAPEPTVPGAVTITVSGSDLILRWAADGNPFYRVYAALNAAGPYDELVDTVTTNELTLPLSPANVRRFYIVCGWNGQ